MCREEDQAAAHVRFGCFEMFEAVRFRQVLELLERACRKLAEKTELAAEVVETLAQKFGAFLFGLFGKGETQIGGACFRKFDASIYASLPIMRPADIAAGAGR
jgi:hypothetical protein